MTGGGWGGIPAWVVTDPSLETGAASLVWLSAGRFTEVVPPAMPGAAVGSMAPVVTSWSAVGVGGAVVPAAAIPADVTG